MKIQEADIGAAVTRYFVERGFEVHHEVSIGYGDWRADLVAVMRRAEGGPLLVVVVECKTSMTLDVMAQAARWLPYCHQSFVAVPRCQKSEGRRLAHQVCAWMGVGSLEVGFRFGSRDGDAEEKAKARLNRRPPCLGKLLDLLGDHNRAGETVMAGNRGGGYWTPFRQTCEELRRFLKSRPDGATMKDVMGSVAHHYSSDSTAGRCLCELARRGKIPGVELDESRKPFVFRFREDEAPGGPRLKKKPRCIGAGA